MISRFLEFLFSLQHVRITPNTRLTFVWNYPVWIALGMIALAVIGYTFYFPQAASPNKKRAMGIVRALLLITVFLLIFRPELVMEHEEKTRSVVAVWVDSSASMQLEDPYANARRRCGNFSNECQSNWQRQQPHPHRREMGRSGRTDTRWPRRRLATRHGSRN